MNETTSINIDFPNDRIKEVNRKGINDAFHTIHAAAKDSVLSNSYTDFADFRDANGKINTLTFSLGSENYAGVDGYKTEVLTAITDVHTFNEDDQLQVLGRRRYTFYRFDREPNTILVRISINIGEGNTIDPQKQGEGLNSGLCFIEEEVMQTVISLDPGLQGKTIIAEMIDNAQGRTKPDGAQPQRQKWTENIAKKLGYQYHLTIDDVINLEKTTNVWKKYIRLISRIN